MTLNIPKPQTSAELPLLALFRAETLTLADIVQRLAADQALSGVRRRDLTSAVGRIADAIGLPLGSVPADCAWLRRKLAKIAPARLNISRKTWSNVLANGRAALAERASSRRP